MAAVKTEVLLIGPLKPVVIHGLEAVCTVHETAEAKDRDIFFARHATVRAIACSDTRESIPATVLSRFPGWKSSRRSVSATTISTSNGPRRTESSSPTRRTC